ncbi:MAG: leucine-rich repeat protein [Ruminococcus sp.]|nr:leucine-rich repeat protein [Candidatus Copronaster equi]
MKKLIAVILSVIFILPLGISNVFAEEYENFTYAIHNNEIEITGYTSDEVNVVIPAEIDGKPVTSIGYQAFYNKAIKSVAIPSTVTCISNSAFMLCTELTDVYCDMTQEEWDNVDIERNNTELLNATLHLKDAEGEDDTEDKSPLTVILNVLKSIFGVVLKLVDYIREYIAVII